MGKQDDGGLAFPCRIREGEFTKISSDGMFLRDWFAGKALTGILASATEEWNYATLQRNAEEAYLLACAMLEERKKFLK